MRQGSSTVICLTGTSGLVNAATQRLDEAANVGLVAGGKETADTPAEVTSFLGQARTLYERASWRQTPYSVTRLDPLAPVRDAWVRRFAGQPDTLEEFSGVYAGANVELPDYYLVVHDPNETERLVFEWYAGLVRDSRPSRVIVVPVDIDREEAGSRAAEALRGLSHGPWWPAPATIVDGARRFIPSAATAGISR